MNLNRAEWAKQALETFICKTGTDWDTALPDLLGDLMHLCDHETLTDGETGFNFAAALDTARMHYQAEINGED